MALDLEQGTVEFENNSLSLGPRLMFGYLFYHVKCSELVILLI